MSRQRLTIGCTGWLVAAWAAIVLPSCGVKPRQPAQSLLPDPRVARDAVGRSLAEWRDSPQVDTTAATGRSVIFVDQQRQPGQKLREFAVVGEYVVDNRRRFVVKLALAEPDESVLAAYYVFGDRPIWVYRVEDFDMMMNMDSMPDDQGVRLPRASRNRGRETTMAQREARTPRNRQAGIGTAICKVTKLCLEAKPTESRKNGRPKGRARILGLVGPAAGRGSAARADRADRCRSAGRPLGRAQQPLGPVHTFNNTREQFQESRLERHGVFLPDGPRRGLRLAGAVRDLQHGPGPAQAAAKPSRCPTGSWRACSFRPTGFNWRASRRLPRRFSRSLRAV